MQEWGLTMDNVVNQERAANARAGERFMKRVADGLEAAVRCKQDFDRQREISGLTEEKGTAAGIAKNMMEEAGMTVAVMEDLADAIQHGILVSRLASTLAHELGENEEFVQDVAIAGMLHDIGKLRLSEYLYGRKEDTLVVEEMKYVRMHATFSYEILQQMGYKEEIQKMVYHHHENYDGSGYPDNLKGHAIPWGARILRTCDVFAALTSKRPYREAFDVDTALELMVDEVKNFDMKIFLTFQTLVFSEEFEEIAELIQRVNMPNNRLEEWVEYLILHKKQLIMAHSLGTGK